MAETLKGALGETLRRIFLVTGVRLEPDGSWQGRTAPQATPSPSNFLGKHKIRRWYEEPEEGGTFS